MIFSYDTVSPPSSQPTACMMKLVCASTAGQMLGGFLGAVVVYAVLTRRLQRPAARAQYIEDAAVAGSDGSAA